MNIRFFIQYLSIAFFALSIAACNDNDSGDDDAKDDVLTGTFIDAPVKGLGYQTKTQQGTTSDTGEFHYHKDEDVTFYLDGVELGSASGAAEIPVTQLPSTPDLARILQTLDSDPSAELIDLSSVSLTDEQKVAIPKVLSKDIHISEAGLGELVDEGAAAAHVAANVSTIKWSDDLLSGNLYVDQGDTEAALLRLDANGMGRFVEYTDLQNGFFQTSGIPMSWSIDEGKDKVAFVLAGEEGDETLQMDLFGRQDASTLDVVITDMGEQESFLAEFKQPLSMAGIEGKHLREDTSNNSDCEDRTFSFTATSIIERGLCSSYYEVTYARDVNPPMNNVLSGVSTSSSGSVNEMHMALLSGSIESGKITQIRYRDGAVRHLRYDRQFTLVDSPLQAPDI